MLFYVRSLSVVVHCIDVLHYVMSCHAVLCMVWYRRCAMLCTSPPLASEVSQLLLFVIRQDETRFDAEQRNDVMPQRAARRLNRSLPTCNAVLPQGQHRPAPAQPKSNPIKRLAQRLSEKHLRELLVVDEDFRVFDVDDTLAIVADEIADAAQHPIQVLRSHEAGVAGVQSLECVPEEVVQIRLRHDAHEVGVPQRLFLHVIRKL
mmetsp:Transcript_4263/g.11138  ORF Transcript_4263/g.11138 Transcript_4263/m.11138 type:complete len:205 (-) Transcript_4263:1015-1629(-)